MLWSQAVANGDESSPAVDAGSVYVTYSGGQDYAFDRLTGAPLWHHNGPSEGGGGTTPVVGDGLVLARDPVSASLLLSSADGSSAGPLSAGPAPALAGGIAYELSAGTLTAVNQSGRGTDAWQFTGDGHLDTAPLAVGALVVVGSSTGELYTLDSAGSTVWSGNVGAPIPAPDEHNVSQPLTGLGAGEGTLIVPAGSTLVAYTAAGDASGIPTSQDAPRVDGAPQAGTAIGADVGTWTGLPSEYSYQWQSCDGSGASCVPISGATQLSYTPSETDVNSTLRVAVIATNASGSAPAVTSGASLPVTEPAFGNVTSPTISGSPIAGHTLTAAPGGWAGGPTSFTYQWLYCDQASCQPEPGGTGVTYVVDPTDIGYQLAVRVTAANASASAASVSTPTATVTTLGPGNLALPSIAGIAQVGQVLRATVGLWTGSPTVYRQQWFSCDAGLNSCTPLDGATQGTYVVQPADTGRVLGVVVSASNAQGDSAPAVSDPTAVVAAMSTPAVTHPLAPVTPDVALVNLTAPTVYAARGGMSVGATLGSTVGTWSATANYAYQWLSCNAAGNACVPVPGATVRTYAIRGSDAGHTLRLRVTATSISHSATAESAASAPIAAAAPPAGGHPATSSLAGLGVTTTLTPHTIAGLLAQGLGLSLHCSAGCQMTVTLSSATALHGVGTRVAQQRLSLGAGAARRLALRPTRAAGAALRHLGHVTLHLVVAVTQGRRIQTARMTIVLRR